MNAGRDGPAVSEVATDALTHGEGDVRLHLLADARRVRVEISDASDALPTERHDGLDAEGGRGLGLLESLSDTWGGNRVQPTGKTSGSNSPADVPAGPRR